MHILFFIVLNRLPSHPSTWLTKCFSHNHTLCIGSTCFKRHHRTLFLLALIRTQRSLNLHTFTFATKMFNKLIINLCNMGICIEAAWLVGKTSFYAVSAWLCGCVSRLQTYSQHHPQSPAAQPDALTNIGQPAGFWILVKRMRIEKCWPHADCIQNRLILFLLLAKTFILGCVICAIHFAYVRV